MDRSKNYVAYLEEISLISLLFAGVSFLATYLLMPQVSDMVRERLVRPNHANEEIPVGLGMIFVLVVVPLIILLVLLTQITVVVGLIWLLSLMGFGMLGFIDDTLGSREARGFCGHFRALLGGQLTTGALKALFGAGIALLVALFTADQGVTIIVNTLVISLFANLFNLLDVRPGRSSKAFLFLALPLFTLTLPPLPMALLVASVLAYIPWDLQSKVMMGDVGANVLGAAYGLAVLTIPLSFRLLVLLFLVAIHVYAERFSLSQAIEGNSFLQMMDSWGRKKV